MYVLARFGNAKLQSLTLKRITPAPPKTINATNPWDSNFDPATNIKTVPEQPKTASVFKDPIVLNGFGTGAQWEITAKVTSSEPALQLITLMDKATRAVVCSFEANASGSPQVTAVRFTE